MTALVGFMNKHGVAIAADSAVTFGNTHKVVNTGNKIFSLSKYAPVGIATYGNAAFMETPWELVIKLYRKQLGRKKYDTLEKYIDSFLSYLHKNEFFISDDTKKRILRNRAVDFYDICVRQSRARVGFSGEKSVEFLQAELEECQTHNAADKINQFAEMKKCSKRKFLSYFQKEFSAVLPEMQLLVDNKAMQDIFLSAFYQYLTVYIRHQSDSGLVFFGYGEEDLYPSMINIVVADSFGTFLRYKRIDGSSGRITTDGTSACVTPYAQVDVAQTIIRGINPSFWNIIQASVSEVLDNYRDFIFSKLQKDPINDSLANEMQRLNHEKVAQQFVSQATSEFRQQYTDKLLNTVAHLSKEDMAKLAESLVELTSLVRRMSPEEETVGGPVDVAVVSKGDGFIWIKRKHYFDPQLNVNFINNYRDDE